jgi:hypothetical protein
VGSVLGKTIKQKKNKERTVIGSPAQTLNSGSQDFCFEGEKASGRNQKTKEEIKKKKGGRRKKSE